MSRRFDSLDHFRGFAALWVVVFHTYAVWIEDGRVALPTALAWFSLNGWRGVQVFFVISGYCITERLARDWGTDALPARFAIDRAWRILPPYWAALAFSIAANVVTVPFNHTPLLATDTTAGAIPSSVRAWLEILALAETWRGVEPYLLVSWTLSYELAFYLLAAGAFCIARMARRGAPAFALGAGLAAVGAFTVVGDHLPVLRSWADFFLGSLVWVVVHRRSTLGGVATIVFATAPLYLPRGNSWTAIVTAAALLLVYPIDARLATARATRWLRFLGTMSFSLYLVHVPVVSKIRNLAGRWAESSVTAIPAGLIAVAAAVAAAWVFFRCVEQPSEALRKSHFARIPTRLRSAEA